MKQNATIDTRWFPKDKQMIKIHIKQIIANWKFFMVSLISSYLFSYQVTAKTKAKAPGPAAIGALALAA